MVKDRLKYALTALALIAGATVLVLTLRPQERPLLPRATRIVRISNAYPFYWWVSDNEILTFRDPGHDDWTLLRLDVNARQGKPVEELTRLFAKSGGRPDSVQVAPDGKGILWTGAQGGTIVATVDGARHFEYPPGEPGEKRWMFDSGHWVELVREGTQFTHAIFHEMDRPRESRVKPVLPAVVARPDAIDVAGMAATTDGHVLVTFWNGQAGKIDPARIVALSFTANTSEIGRFLLHPPHDVDRGALVFSPLYGRLAWVLEYQPPLSTLTGERTRTGLWVSSMQDWKAHEIGSLETTRDGKGGSGPFAVQWSPDGGRLSFVYRDALWTVPAD
jgi:hypothetical protein